MPIEGKLPEGERPRSAFAQKLLDDPALAARCDEVVAQLRAELLAADPTFAEEDGTQRWPFAGNNVWLGDPDSSPYGPNGEDILVGGE